MWRSVFRLESHFGDHWPSHQHVITANEGNAIGLAAGHHLGRGTIPLVYMQNSGMGNAFNPLASLTHPTVYGIPMILLIGWRGDPTRQDWPQHQVQGQLSPTLLENLDIPYQIVGPNDTDPFQALTWAHQQASETEGPTALLVRKGVLALKEKAGFDAETQKYPLSREDAIRTILASAPDDTIYVASTGRITRELHAIREDLGQPHDHDFLNVGAMGHALSIAAGIAAARPGRQVICLDGDGASIMHLGSQPVTANLPLPNLIHIVLNNGAHESVGGQPTTGHAANLTAVAAAAGYTTLASHAETADQLKEAVATMLRSDRPSFIEMRIRKGMRADMPILKANLDYRKIQTTLNQ